MALLRTPPYTGWTTLQIPLGARQTSPVISLHAEWHTLGHPMPHGTLPSLHHHDSTPNSPSDVPLCQLGCGSLSPIWLPGARQPLLVRSLQAYDTLGITPPLPQPTRQHSPILPWKFITHMAALHALGLPLKHCRDSCSPTLLPVGLHNLSQPPEAVHRWTPSRPTLPHRPPQLPHCTIPSKQSAKPGDSLRKPT